MQLNQAQYAVAHGPQIIAKYSIKAQSTAMVSQVP